MANVRSVAIVCGDGIGKEVIPVARDVLCLLHPEYELFPVEVGYERWERTGEAMGDDDFALLKSADAILFGAITTPSVPDYRSVLLRIRKVLDLFANVRPVKGNGFDITIVRENIEGLYSGIEEVGVDRATTLRVLTRHECERIARYACNLAGSRTLTIGHKANVMKSDVFFRDICLHEASVAGVNCNDRLIDALCLDVLLHPASYHVIVTTNMFGDILSDVAAYLVGGLGMLPSANIGERHAFFEPVHGSAPDIAGRNVANPVAALRSAALLLRYAGDNQGSDAIECAIQTVFSKGIKTRDLGGSVGTKEFGEAVLKEIGLVGAG